MLIRIFIGLQYYLGITDPVTSPNPETTPSKPHYPDFPDESHRLLAFRKLGPPRFPIPLESQANRLSTRLSNEKRAYSYSP